MQAQPCSGQGRISSWPPRGKDFAHGTQRCPLCAQLPPAARHGSPFPGPPTASQRDEPPSAPSRGRAPATAATRLCLPAARALPGTAYGAGAVTPRVYLAEPPPARGKGQRESGTLGEEAWEGCPQAEHPRERPACCCREP